MLSPIDLEYRIQSAEYYFATLMDQVVDESMQLEPVDESFISRVDNLFYTIEAIRFLFDRGIYTDNDTCLAVYQDMMDQIGINVSLPNVSIDSTLVIPGFELPVPFIGPQGPQGPQGIFGSQGFQGPRGFQGFQGPQGFGAQGSQGSQGPQGSQGAQGSQGSQGPQGFQGANGTSVVIKGAVQSVSNLPSSGNTPGDLYIVLDDGDGYVWDGVQWDNIGQIQGPQGFQGPQGAQGFQGAGSQGPQGPQGPSGSAVSGTANNVVKFTSPTTLGNSSIVDNETTIFITGVATPDKLDVVGGIRLDGPLTLGGVPVTNEVFSVTRSITGNATSYGIRVDSATSSDVTTESAYVSTHPILFHNISAVNHFKTSVNFFGGTVLNQTSFWATSTAVGATNNYGFRASLPVGANNWNIFADGTAKNFFNGKILLGSNTDSGSDILQVTGSSSFSSSITANAFVKSGGTAFQFLKADGTIDSNNYVTFGRTLTINGVTQDLSANRTWTIDVGVTSFNTRTGAITLTNTDVTNALGYSPYPSTNPSGYINRSQLSANAPLFYDSGTGNFSIFAASGITNGFLTSTDWNTFNNKQNALGFTPVPNTRTLTINGTTFDLTANRSWSVGNITGSGTANFVPIFTTGTNIGNSNIFLASVVTVGLATGIGASPADSPVPSRLYVDGPGYVNGDLRSSSQIIATSTITGSAIIRAGGTSSQFLKADGSVDSTAYVSGSGSTNTLAKFTSGNILGNSIITDNGTNVGVGVGSPAFKLEVAGNIYASADVLAFSDISVKENIRPIDNALERVLNSRGVVYDRIDTEDKDNIGFIAQELEVNFPELVFTKEDGTKSVKYQNAVAVLFEAIKGLQSQIDELKK